MSGTRFGTLCKRPYFAAPGASFQKKALGQTEKPATLPGVTQQEKDLEDARLAGIDLDLLDTLQALSISERWRQHDAAANLAAKLAEARQALDAGSQRTP